MAIARSLTNVPGQVRAGGVTFGVCYNMDDDGSFDYLAGVEVSGFSDLPPHAPFAACPDCGGLMRRIGRVLAVHVFRCDTS